MAKWILLAGVVAVAFAQSPREAGSDRERALEAALVREVERVTTPLNDDAVRNYVDRVASKIARVCAPARPIQIHLVAATEADAFTLLGGQIYVQTGLVTRAANEAELAGVLAHLIAFARQGWPRLENSRMSVFAGGWNGYSFRHGIELGPAAIVKAVRDQTLTADRDAIRCLDQAGYDPEGLLAAIRVLNDTERLSAAAQAAAGLAPRSEYVLDASEFGAVQRRVQSFAEARVRRSPPSLRNPRRR